MHALVICRQRSTPIFVGSSPSSQSRANRLNLVPLDDLELHYPNRCIGNMEFLVHSGWGIGFWPPECFAIKIMMNELISIL